MSTSEGTGETVGSGEATRNGWDPYFSEGVYSQACEFVGLNSSGAIA
jgi:hypothetical protein